MSYKSDSKDKKSKGVEVYNIIHDDVRSELEVLDLEDGEEEELGSVEVFNIIPDDIRSRLEVLDFEDE